MTSAVGGGSLPGETLESVGLRVVGAGRRRLRRGSAPAIRRSSARVEAGAVWLDLRTIDPAEDAALAGARSSGPSAAASDRMTVVIGTAGHIDHGKTTLLRALTGIDADRLPEERRRGMTIDVGYAHLRLPDGTELDFVDVPGHDRLVGNMLVGAGEIDAAMLVVAADDGPRAQTIEHLALLDALEIRHGIAVVTKADMAGPARTAEVVAGVARLLEGTTLAGSPVLAVSSVDGGGIEALRDALVDAARRDGPGAAVPWTAGASSAGEPGARLAIDRVFAVKGRGVVVTGTLRGRGIGRDADPPARAGRPDGPGPRDPGPRRRPWIAPSPGGRRSTWPASRPGDLHRGIVLTDDPSVVGQRPDPRRHAPRPARPVAGRACILGTAAVEARVGRSGRDALDLPDGSALATLRLAAPIAVAPGDRAVLRRSSGTERVVGATVLDVAPPRGISRRRQTVERVGAARDGGRIGRSGRDRGGQARPPRCARARGPAPSRSPRMSAPTSGAAVVEAVDGAMSLTAARAVAARALRRRVDARSRCGGVGRGRPGR